MSLLKEDLEIRVSTACLEDINCHVVRDGHLARTLGQPQGAENGPYFKASKKMGASVI